MSFNIVYLDDEEELCEMFVDLFSTSDVTVKSYVQPDDAILAISSHPPDLVFLDYRLPNITGDQVAIQICETIPKILLTGDILVQTEYPFFKVFHKPYDQIEIEKVISYFYDLKRKAG